MAAIPSSRILRPGLSSKNPDALLSFLVPSIQCMRNAPVARFSTSPALCKKDNNKTRGLSAVRNTGLRPRQTLSVKNKDFENQQLPKPVKIENKVTGTPDHGLWDFFKDQQLLQTPVEEQRHGRAWTVGELRSRDWDSLHQLWWVCVKERNRLATEKIERKRLEAGYGDLESTHRDRTVQETMKAILDTLAERQIAYQEALELAKRDPSIDLSRTDGPQYTQEPYDPLESEEAPYDAQPEPAVEEPAKAKTLA
ncbi:MRP-L47-domain-containing protein [Cucurbitaria berberidis CBS 394.84]|uniref:Large ribosomal subunit protein uL29m n=1 Tax=Cucurbitaria berberidis CBS 394.84 TaxID=1168544 RepID=A0A9P4GDG9_9PLEO|nr:MRP-L47-domain-containing protein [Cucurbitaria berberidis CBS 394.84]KAF1843570.1 MRP-L47-domain-containing protein [Cucurbitaria berberidis CBS 394.84]